MEGIVHPADCLNFVAHFVRNQEHLKIKADCAGGA